MADGNCERGPGGGFQSWLRSRRESFRPGPGGDNTIRRLVRLDVRLEMFGWFLTFVLSSYLDVREPGHMSALSC